MHNVDYGTDTVNNYVDLANNAIDKYHNAMSKFHPGSMIEAIGTGALFAAPETGPAAPIIGGIGAGLMAIGALTDSLQNSADTKKFNEASRLGTLAQNAINKYDLMRFDSHQAQSSLKAANEGVIMNSDTRKDLEGI